MMSRKRWLLLYAAAIAAAVIAGFNDHGLIPGLPSSIIGSILNQLVKTVGLLGVGDMVLYFRAKEDLDREREDHQRTRDDNERMRAESERMRDENERVRAENAELRAAQLELVQQQAESNRVVIERMQRLEDEMRLLRSENRNGNGTGNGNPDGNPGDALS